MLLTNCAACVAVIMFNFAFYIILLSNFSLVGLKTLHLLTCSYRRTVVLNLFQIRQSLGSKSGGIFEMSSKAMDARRLRLI